MRDVHKLFFLKTLNKFFHCLKQLFRNISSRNIKSIDVHFKQQYIVLFYWVTTHSKCLSQFRDCYLKGHQRWHYLKKNKLLIHLVQTTLHIVALPTRSMNLLRFLNQSPTWLPNMREGNKVVVAILLAFIQSFIYLTYYKQSLCTFELTNAKINCILFNLFQKLIVYKNQMRKIILEKFFYINKTRMKCFSFLFIYLLCNL